MARVPHSMNSRPRRFQLVQSELIALPPRTTNVYSEDCHCGQSEDSGWNAHVWCCNGVPTSLLGISVFSKHKNSFSQLLVNTEWPDQRPPSQRGGRVVEEPSRFRKIQPCTTCVLCASVRVSACMCVSLGGVGCRLVVFEPGFCSVQ